MPKGVLVVETAPSSPEADAEFNDFYNNIHLIDVLKVAGFKSARRFRKLGESPHPYLAIYEVEADDLQAAMAELSAAAKRGDVRAIPSTVIIGPAGGLYEQIYELSE
jgi:hypothetical protein